MCPNFGGQPCTIVLSLDHSGLAVPQRRSSADIPTRPWYYTYREDGKPTQAVDPKAASAVIGMTDRAITQIAAQEPAPQGDGTLVHSTP